MLLFFLARKILSLGPPNGWASQKLLAHVRGNARCCARSHSGWLVMDVWFPKASKKASAPGQSLEVFFYASGV